MNWTDYLIIGVLGLSVIGGLWRGLVSEVLALVVWVAAFWAAWAWGPVLAARCEHLVASPAVRIIGAYVVCFVVVLLVGAVLRFVCQRLIDGIGLGGPDRLFGALFGLARGILLVTLLVFLAGFTAVTHDPWWRQSVLLPHFQQAAIWMQQRIPADIGKYLHPERVLEQLPRLRALAPDPISGVKSSAPAASARGAVAVPASSATTHARHQ